MFSTLIQRIKCSMARLFYEIARTRYEAQHWTQTRSCSSCSKQIPYDALFCAYCGKHLNTAATTPLPAQPTLAFDFPENDSLDIKPISIILPEPKPTPQSFLSYVRSTKENVGPATMAHRQVQDYYRNPSKTRR
ncbi:hypothetical protein [Dictyobacter arantiisoli]|uniref:Zinc-ribbon domain-containing protein n=1 Tax=Dictyobacter arantiisoli TaxID=2014874 RepID=A0A5A5TG28_9CHLR|nr:hypothetical protein [Dictyobacter arantiisoli]GCF10317.1 hypothetical protein KDI_38810 [Dictyobacter arantiisoli]